MNMGWIAVGVFSAVVLYVLIWVFIRPFKQLVKILLKSALGAGAIWCVNLLLARWGVRIGLNIGSALVCGLFGVPGFLMLGTGSWLIK